MKLLFLFDFSFHDLYWLGAGIVGTLIVVGAIAGAIKGIKGEFWTPFNEYFLEPRRRRRRQFDELIESVETLKTQTASIEAEVKPNGGGSMKDAVIRIEKHCDYANAKFRYHDETSDKAVFEMDEEANITYANRATCILFGADESELTGKNWISKIPALERQSTLQEYRIAAENKCPLVDMEHTVFSGKKRIAVSVRATPRFNRNGELRGFFGQFTEISKNNG